MPQKRLRQAERKPRIGRDSLSPRSSTDLRRLTRKELQALAVRKGLKGGSRLKKEELAQALISLLGLRPERRSEQPSKSRAAAPPPPALFEEEKPPLPAVYGKTCLVLLPVDPFWVHAYWELSGQDTPKAGDDGKKRSERFRWILRVYDVTFIQFDGTNAHSSFDIKITPHARNWYINLSSPQKSLCAELGRIRADGTFFPVARSNVVQTASAWVSPNTEESWMQVVWEKKSIYPDESRIQAVPATPGHRLPGQVSASTGATMESVPLPGLSKPEIDAWVAQKKLISPEEYRCFLGETRRRYQPGREEIDPSTSELTPLQVAARNFESGLSSLELMKNPSFPADAETNR